MYILKATYDFENGVGSTIQKSATDVKKQDLNNVDLKNNNDRLGTYLGSEKIIKMLNKFLSEKDMPKEKLAELLEVNLGELDDLLNKQASALLIQKVNLPLIKLFCETKF